MPLGTTVFAVISVVFAVLLSPMLFKNKWDPRGQHCYVTGGSSGMGLALAILLTKRGADVSIVARNKERLDKALEQLEAVRQAPTQVLKAYSYAVDSAARAEAALNASSEPHGGRCPDAVFLCAGAARPGFFVEHDEALLKQGMDDTYWVQAWTALAAAKRMVRERVKGKIVFTASVLGYMSMIGYSAYSPGKFALRGLAESLQSEFVLYGIDVHISFPGTIYTPGYETENLHKPKIVLKIEESDAGQSPEAIAQAVLYGVQKGHFHISCDFITDTFRASTAGSSPRNNTFVDMVYGVIGFIVLPIWRWTVDSEVRRHRKEHEQYLTDSVPFNQVSKS
ncbi:oxidoreductase [Amylocystis lapponica]|nr:oxidoreductase [Amylocystis lapponica]